MVWFIRYHVCRRNQLRRVRERYESAIASDVLPTTEEMDAWIASRSRGSPGELRRFAFEISESLLDQTVAHESFEQYYADMRPSARRRVIGRRTRCKTKCVICMSVKRTKIRVSCEHVFHRECIEGWTAWKTTCPICQSEMRLLPHPPPPPPPPPPPG